MAKQFRREMMRGWDLVDDKFNEDILGKKASEVLLRHAARASHHEFPFSMTVMSQLIACTNGATTEVFPGVRSPIVMTMFNNNYPQTRKSCGFSTGHKIGNAIDKESVEKAKKKLKATLEEHSTQAVDPNRLPPVRLNSSTLSAFTEPAFFQRCAGDWDQVVTSEAHDLRGRVHFSTLVNLDEAYKYFKMVGLVLGSGSGKTQDAQSGQVADAASEVNKLLQTGMATYVTKTSGSFGEGDAPTISLAMTGNSHPSITIPMLRGEYGSDVVAVTYRHMFCSGHPIEPHQALPQRLSLPPGTKLWVWPKLLQCMLTLLGLAQGSDSFDKAQVYFEAVRNDGGQADDDSNDDEEDDELFKPNSSGFRVTLADGTLTRLRFQKDGCNADGSHAWVPELRCANRDIPIPKNEELQDLASRVLKYFESPHKNVAWTKEARLTFKGFQTVFDAQCAVARDREVGDYADAVGEAARFGASPWLLAMFACALFVLEIAVDSEQPPNAAERMIQVSHVVRAYDLLCLLNDIRAAWEGDSSETATRSADTSAVLERAQRLVAGGGLPGFERVGFGDFMPTQAQLCTQATNIASELQPVCVPGEAPEPSLVGAQRLDAEVREEVAGAVPQVAVNAGSKYLLPSDPEVPSMDRGYGPDGVSVQRADC
jgi:hypothetical protein